LSLEETSVRKCIDREERDYYYLIERASDELLKTRILPARFITIADSLYALGLTRFLVNDMGLLPMTQFITDPMPEQHRAPYTAFMNDLEGGLSTALEFVSGSGEAQQRILETGLEAEEKAFILGSGWERSFSAEQKTLSIPVSTPLLDRMVLNRSYAGYSGAMTLLEDMCSLILGRYQ
jgi:nitrogenase molybdenum-iron protein beta chain